MPLHLTKVAYACGDVEALRQRIDARAAEGEVRITTRMRPKRSAELIGGNLFWIVRHTIVGGVEIRRFEDREDGRIDIVCSAEFQLVAPIPRRAHQGWRYFERDSATLDPGDGSGITALPAQLYGRLAALALV